MNVNLSKAENDVCAYLKKGISNNEIAENLFVCEKTVKFHLTNIYKKMNVDCRAKAILILTSMHLDQYPEIKEEFKVEERIHVSRPATVLPNKDNPKGLAVEKPAMSQVEKINFIDTKFKVGKVMDHLYNMMEGVTSQEMSANNVNAACNCVARANETITSCIQAARFLNER